MTSKEIKILGDVVRALRDQNITPQIETVGKIMQGNNSLDTPGGPQMPASRARNYRNGALTFNTQFASSIKVGPDISIKKIANAPTPVKDDHGNVKYEVDNGFYYMVRTRSGEAKFTNINDDFMRIWGALLVDYDHGWGASYNTLTGRLKNEELLAIAKGPSVAKTNKTKLEQSSERMAKIGVTDARFSGAVLADIIAKQKQNQ